MILDTNALTALAARDPTIVERLESAEGIALSFVTIAEFRFGLMGSSRPEAGLELLQVLTSRLPSLFPDGDTPEHYARIADELKRTGRPIPQNDMWTAALARQHQLRVLSRDKHFDFVSGVTRIDW